MNSKFAFCSRVVELCLLGQIESLKFVYVELCRNFITLIATHSNFNYTVLVWFLVSCEKIHLFDIKHKTNSSQQRSTEKERIERLKTFLALLRDYPHSVSINI